MAKEIKSNYKVIGVAGSSMDSLDIAEVSFYKEEKWRFRIERHQTYEYGRTFYDSLIGAKKASLEDQKK